MLTHPKTSTEWGAYSFSQLRHVPPQKSGACNYISLQALRLSKKNDFGGPPGVLIMEWIFFGGYIFNFQFCVSILGALYASFLGALRASTLGALCVPFHFIPLCIGWSNKKFEAFRGIEFFVAYVVHIFKISRQYHFRPSPDIFSICGECLIKFMGRLRPL